MSSVFDKLDSVLRRFQEIEETMARPEVASSFERVQELAKERASLEDLVDISRQHQKLTNEQKDLEELLRDESDLEMTRMAKEELESVVSELEQLGLKLKLALLPRYSR